MHLGTCTNYVLGKDVSLYLKDTEHYETQNIIHTFLPPVFILPEG